MRKIIRLQIGWNSPYPRKLSKEGFSKLPEGAWLATNTFNTRRERCDSPDQKIKIHYEPEFLGKLSAITEREQQWKKIEKTGVKHRQFHLFSSKADAEKYFNNLPFSDGRHGSMQ